MNLFELEDVDLESPKLHATEIYNQTTSNKNLVILALIGAELAAVQILPHPSRACLSVPHSRARVKGMAAPFFVGPELKLQRPFQIRASRLTDMIDTITIKGSIIEGAGGCFCPPFFFPRYPTKL